MAPNNNNNKSTATAAAAEGGGGGGGGGGGAAGGGGGNEPASTSINHLLRHGTLSLPLNLALKECSMIGKHLFAQPIQAKTLVQQQPECRGGITVQG